MSRVCPNERLVTSVLVSSVEVINFTPAADALTIAVSRPVKVCAANRCVFVEVQSEVALNLSHQNAHPRSHIL